MCIVASVWFSAFSLSTLISAFFLFQHLSISLLSLLPGYFAESVNRFTFKTRCNTRFHQECVCNVSSSCPLLLKVSRSCLCSGVPSLLMKEFLNTVVVFVGGPGP